MEFQLAFLFSDILHRYTCYKVVTTLNFYVTYIIIMLLILFSNLVITYAFVALSLLAILEITVPPKIRCNELKLISMAHVLSVYINI